ncbi:hypothetical protein ABT120_27640 [Nonomuraea angiospora]|uniref:hypothetical protein n=1 Tax=Nonomuraea angiospora TaxID=46172 RepID=UPI00331F2BA2
MASEERRAWIMAVVSVCAYGTYIAIILGRAGGTSIAEVPYAATLLWSIGGAIAATIVLDIALSAVFRRGAGMKDRRDREIWRYGQYAGQWCLVLGGLAALWMALAEVDHFWIANVIYLAFVLSSVLGSALKIVAYRRGLPSW